ncbi:GMC family oxidoreductase [Chryseolinea sp. T2]|uniref:GMC family oxidoreductase n=1 Tax=Chryseolinea sp. T2 TaxID=3129255 RepID=UPI0030786418
MFIDSRALSQNQIVETDICIVGSGPAGLAIAHQLNGSGIRVAILEAGDFKTSEEAAALTDGEVVGDPFSPLRDMRIRQFGGMSNVWNIILHQNAIGVRYVPLDPIDFEKRDWVPNSGWPIGYNDLLPFYHRAHKFCQLGDFNYTTEQWDSDGQGATRFQNDDIVSRMFKFGPSDIYFNQYRDEMAASSNVSVYLNANATLIDANEGANAVNNIRVSCLNGNKFEVRAKSFVLAAGALENSRLLLASNNRQASGLGNRHDVVGRYFMDHPLVDFGMLFPFNRSVIASMGLYDKKRVKNETVMGRYAVAESALRREQMLNISALIYPRERRFRSDGNQSIKKLVSSLKRGSLPPNFIHHIANVVKQPHLIVGNWYHHSLRKKLLTPNLAYGEWSLGKDIERFVKFEVLTQTEQTPHPDNRVVLSEQIDSLGVPRVKLINYWRENDIESVRRAQRLFADAFRKAGVGELIFESLPRPSALMSTHHNMGTTRMHSDSKSGVVDANCKVHEISNLYVAGSSVFTTGGYANPTLTIVALAIRLADHLKRSL